MKKIVLFSLMVLGGCSAQQDANVSAAFTKIEGDAQHVIEVVKAAAQKTCPLVIAAAPATQMTTEVVATLIGVPTVGTVTVGLESAVTDLCNKIASGSVTVQTK